VVVAVVIALVVVGVVVVGVVVGTVGSGCVVTGGGFVCVVVWAVVVSAGGAVVDCVRCVDVPRT